MEDVRATAGDGSSADMVVVVEGGGGGKEPKQRLYLQGWLYAVRCCAFGEHDAQFSKSCPCSFPSNRKFFDPRQAGRIDRSLPSYSQAHSVETFSEAKIQTTAQSIYMHHVYAGPWNKRCMFCLNIDSHAAQRLLRHIGPGGVSSVILGKCWSESWMRITYRGYVSEPEYSLIRWTTSTGTRHTSKYTSVGPFPIVLSHQLGVNQVPPLVRVGGRGAVAVPALDECTVRGAAIDIYCVSISCKEVKAQLTHPLRRSTKAS